MLKVICLGGIVAMALTGPASAATSKPRPAPKAPALPAIEPPARTSAVRGGLMTPQTILLRAMSPVETRANAIWSIRAGLNVAALQCQFSPFLATVRNYNDLLKHHSAELAAAQKSMIAHFKRYDGTRALNSFDQYSTRIYNSYSTLDAQYSFCNAAARTGLEVLLLDKGGLGSFALDATPKLRAALAPGAVVPGPGLSSVEPVPMPLVE